MQRLEKGEKLNGAHSERVGKKLDESLDKRLAAYALAAMAAAGVGLMGAATPAEAGTIVTGSPNLTISHKSTPLDLSVQGLGILQFNEGHGTSFAKGIFVRGLSGTQAGVFFSGRFLETAAAFPARLSRGAPIGTNTSFAFFPNSRPATMGGRSSAGGVPPWNGKSGFLGFKLFKNSASYFGWARMSFSEKGDKAHLTEYGLDTVPGQVIDAGQTDVPEPGTLSLLALGALGLLALRNRWSAISHQPSANG